MIATTSLYNSGVFDLPGLAAQRGLSLTALQATFNEHASGQGSDYLRSLREVARFTEAFGSVRLRSYQQAVAKAVVSSVLEGKGHSFVVIFPRQSGKNMLQAQLEVYLMAMLAERGAEMVTRQLINRKASTRCGGWKARSRPTR